MSTSFSYTNSAAKFVMSIFLLLSATPALACTCAPPPPPPGAQRNRIMNIRDLAVLKADGPGSAVIFEGVVEKQVIEAGPMGPPSNAMSMTPNAMHRVVTILVKRGYKGKAQGEVTVLTGMGTGDCGYDFRTGKEYLVFADTIAGDLFTSICTGTGLTERSEPEIRVFRNEPPTADDLMNPESYYAKYVPQWTGSVCGQVSKPDGSPLGGATVDLTELRDNGLPPMTFSDPNLAKPDGSFCIEGVDPGNYLLTAEDTDYDRNVRWMGYFPGVASVSHAKTVQVNEGDNLKGVQFTTQEQRLYTARFRVVTADKTALPWQYLGVAIEGSDGDPLGYHETQHFEEDGSCGLGLIPPGHYSVTTFIQPDPDTSIPPEILKWQMATKEVEIANDAEIILTLTPATHPVP